MPQHSELGKTVMMLLVAAKATYSDLYAIVSALLLQPWNEIWTLHVVDWHEVGMKTLPVDPHFDSLKGMSDPIPTNSP